MLREREASGMVIASETKGSRVSINGSSAAILCQMQTAHTLRISGSAYS